MAPPASSTTGGLEVVVLSEIKLNLKSKAQDLEKLVYVYKTSLIYWKEIKMHGLLI
jgi:hypothetical protein